MSTPGSLIDQERASAPEARPIMPTEPTLWQRYSPHHEFPISTLATVILYGFAAVLVVGLGALAFRWTSAPPSMTIHNVEIAPKVDPDEEGGGSGLGRGNDEHNRTRLSEENAPPTFEPMEDRPLNQLNLGAVGSKPILTSDSTADTRRFKQGPKELRSKGEKDEDGSGRGRGNHVGDGTGPSRSRTKQRMDRWILTFRFSSSEEYVDRLANLRAIVVFPAGQDRFLVFHDLGRRVSEGKIESLAEVQQLKRLYWKDPTPRTVEALADALGVSPPPTHFWVFFPSELEKVLLEKELSYRDLKEAEIVKRRLETTFEAERQGDKWIVRVIKQEKMSEPDPAQLKRFGTPRPK